MTFRAVLIRGELVPVSANLGALIDAEGIYGPTRNADRDEFTAVQNAGPNVCEVTPPASQRSVPGGLGGGE